MTPVEPRQVWSILLGSRDGRSEFQVVTVDDPSLPHPKAHGKLVRSGRALAVRVSCLARGLRGARLVSQADGTPVAPTPRGPAGLERLHKAEFQKTASDYRKVTRPRGETTPLRQCEIDALQMVADGKTHPQIAQHFEVSVGAVRSWLAKARAAQSEQRLRSLT